MYVCTTLYGQMYSQTTDYILLFPHAVTVSTYMVPFRYISISCAVCGSKSVKPTLVEELEQLREGERGSNNRDLFASYNEWWSHHACRDVQGSGKQTSCTFPALVGKGR